MKEDKAITETKKWFPELKITIVPSMDKGIGNPKKVADMKRVLSTVKWPLPTRE